MVTIPTIAPVTCHTGPDSAFFNEATVSPEAVFVCDHVIMAGSAGVRKRFACIIMGGFGV